MIVMDSDQPFPQARTRCFWMRLPATHPDVVAGVIVSRLERAREDFAARLTRIDDLSRGVDGWRGPRQRLVQTSRELWTPERSIADRTERRSMKGGQVLELLALLDQRCRTKAVGRRRQMRPPSARSCFDHLGLAHRLDRHRCQVAGVGARDRLAARALLASS